MATRGRNSAMSHVIGRPDDHLLDVMLGGADPEQTFIEDSELRVRGRYRAVRAPRRRSGSISPVTTLVVLDQGEAITFSFDDLLKYHGRSSIAGLAHAFKAMERAFPLLSPGEPPERYDITVESGFPGGGARDAFEMVTRAVTGERFRLTSAPAGTQAPEAPGGHFFFRLANRGTVVGLTARAGLVPADFVDVACREAPTPVEAARAVQLKEEMAERLLGLPAEDVYDADVDARGGR